MTDKWIQNARVKKGALHSQLGYKKDEKIPTSVLEKIVNADIGDTVTIKGEKRRVTSTLKKRANFALNVRK